MSKKIATLKNEITFMQAEIKVFESFCLNAGDRIKTRKRKLELMQKRLNKYEREYDLKHKILCQIREAKK